MSLYKRMKDAGVQIENHESDLHVRVDNRMPHALLKLAEKKYHGKLFIDPRDGSMWLDVPFMFDPWWENSRERLGG